MGFGPVQISLKGRVNHRWNDGHVAQARSWTVSGVWTKQKLHDKFGGQQKKKKNCETKGAEKHRFFHCREWKEDGDTEKKQHTDVAKSCEMKVKQPKEVWKWQRSMGSHPEFGSWMKGKCQEGKSGESTEATLVTRKELARLNEGSTKSVSWHTEECGTEWNKEKEICGKRE